MTRGPADSSPMQQIKETLERYITQSDKESLSNVQRKKLQTEIRDTLQTLSNFLTKLDPIKQPSSVFDPSNPKTVARFIALALVAQERYPLASLSSFYGSGVYAIYYKGNLPEYAPISGTETPIYIGQAGPAVNNAKTPKEQEDRLTRRLFDHQKNIAKATTTLNTGDFDYRALVVQSGFETQAEDFLIHLFCPIWNNEVKILFGIGKHGDSGETRANKRSPWDVLHPGREWAAHSSLEDAKSRSQIMKELSAHFQKQPPFESIEAVMKEFFDGLRQS